MTWTKSAGSVQSSSVPRGGGLSSTRRDYLGVERGASGSPFAPSRIRRRLEAMASEPQDPVPLVRPAGLREPWFDAQPPRSSLTSIPPSAPSGAFAHVTAGRALLAGAIAGLFGGIAFAIVPGLASTRVGHYVDVAAVFGVLVASSVRDARLVGVVACALVGLVFGALVIFLTRHVKRALPIALFGIVFTPVAWLAFQALLLPRFSPWLASMLPIGPMLLGAAAGGLSLALAIPIRGR